MILKQSIDRINSKKKILKGFEGISKNTNGFLQIE